MLDAISATIAKHGVAERVSVGGEPERAVVGFPGDVDMVAKSWTQQCMAEAGVLFNGSMFICRRHDEADIDRALDAFDAACAEIAAGTDLRSRLLGPPVQPVFRTP
jgi:glutamate-1-semialdehyde aminotransferase